MYVDAMSKDWVSIEEIDKRSLAWSPEESPRLLEAMDRFLDSRHREVLIRRFGIEGEEETLEAIGRSLGRTREGIRHIEAQALKKLRGKKVRIFMGRST
jgi:DNA-directed RNA polymerase sigma subunit (sigma70/sigma32)